MVISPHSTSSHPDRLRNRSHPSSHAQPFPCALANNLDNPSNADLRLNTDRIVNGLREW